LYQLAMVSWCSLRVWFWVDSLYLVPVGELVRTPWPTPPDALM
jgi:hypothetical protein